MENAAQLRRLIYEVDMENAQSKLISSGSPPDRDSSQSVRVAVNVRPLITPELLNGCTDCITVVPGEPQVQIGSLVFTYDYVYGSKGSPSSKIFDDCVAPLVDALFKGYNATVLAYGQTGSGKTYTMGTNYHGDENINGVIPRVVESIFKRVEMIKSSSEFLIRVSFIEIFKEEVFDLLDSSSSLCKGDGLPSSRTTGGRRGTRISYSMNFPRGFHLEKRIHNWVDQWQALPYISPYEDAFHLALSGDCPVSQSV